MGKGVMEASALPRQLHPGQLLTTSGETLTRSLQAVCACLKSMPCVDSLSCTSDASQLQVHQDRTSVTLVPHAYCPICNWRTPSTRHEGLQHTDAGMLSVVTTEH